MKVLLFLGAGASTNYGMPATRKLKEELAKEHAGGEEKEGGTGGGGEQGVWQDLLSVENELDIEHVLLLADTVDRLNEVEGGKELVRNGGRIGRQLEEVMKIGRAVRREVFKKYAWDHELDESACRLLGPLVDMAMGMNGDGQVSVFTTNYDRAVEEFCKGRGLRMRDGFRLDAKTGRRVWDAEFGFGKVKGDAGDAGDAGGAVRLYKLHGSLDWKRSDKHDVLRVDYDGASDSPRYHDVIIHPSLADKGGEIRDKPYEEIYESFKKELESSDACVVVGFSFRDRHIADDFREFAEQNDKTLVVVGPDSPGDVHRRILEKELPDRGDAADKERAVRVSSLIKGKSRRAVVIEEKWTLRTTREIAILVRSVIEVLHDMRPVHTLGACTECVEKMTIDDMEKHVRECHNMLEGKKVLLLRIAEHAVGAPWMFVLAQPGASLRDLEKFLQSEWVQRYYSDTQHKNVKFAPDPLSSGMGTETALSDVPWADVSVWYDDTDGLQVAVVGSMNISELYEPVKALAVGEKLPLE